MITAAVLAKRTDTPIFTVRYYTRIGLLKPSRDIRNGYRVYKASDRNRLRFIIPQKNLVSLAEIQEILTTPSMAIAVSDGSRHCGTQDKRK